MAENSRMRLEEYDLIHQQAMATAQSNIKSLDEIISPYNQERDQLDNGEVKIVVTSNDGTRSLIVETFGEFVTKVTYGPVSIEVSDSLPPHNESVLSSDYNSVLDDPRYDAAKQEIEAVLNGSYSYKRKSLLRSSAVLNVKARDFVAAKKIEDETTISQFLPPRPF